jgi:hypothetical protein
MLVSSTPFPKAISKNESSNFKSKLEWMQEDELEHKSESELERKLVEELEQKPDLEFLK